MTARQEYFQFGFWIIRHPQWGPSDQYPESPSRGPYMNKVVTPANCVHSCGSDSDSYNFSQFSANMNTTLPVIYLVASRKDTI